MNALIGDEEQNGKQKKEEKERNKERDPNSATQDHLVTYYDPHGTHIGPILKPTQQAHPLPPHRENTPSTSSI